MRKDILRTLLAMVLIAFIAIQISAVSPTAVERHLQVKGWLIGKAAQFAGERTWGTTGTADTLVITGVDTLCAVLLTPKTTGIENLYYDIRSAGDTVFVTSDSSGTASTDKYSYVIIYNAYGASD